MAMPPGIRHSNISTTSWHEFFCQISMFISRFSHKTNLLQGKLSYWVIYQKWKMGNFSRLSELFPLENRPINFGRYATDNVPKMKTSQSRSYNTFLKGMKIDDRFDQNLDFLLIVNYCRRKRIVSCSKIHSRFKIVKLTTEGPKEGMKIWLGKSK